MFDIVQLEPSLSADGSVIAGFNIMEDGKPYVDYEVTYHGMTAGKVAELKAHADKWLKNAKLTGLSYKEMHNAQKSFAKHMFDLGDKHPKNK